VRATQVIVVDASGRRRFLVGVISVCHGVPASP
jgi:hypothetical protein